MVRNDRRPPPETSARTSGPPARCGARARGRGRRGAKTMSSRPQMSLYQIRMEGWKALTERLGPSGAMRFMMQYDPGSGDYSKERHEIFAGVTIEELLEFIGPGEPEPPEADRR